uniref:Uncharacterized protein n=1 Tax=Rhizophora mucronata TaxID=61149 RepID=A0A2P2NBX0_RHIMU
MSCSVSEKVKGKHRRNKSKRNT